ncbi:MAG: hypothetical protein HOU81_02845 [Hamadaea sp.]|nr:hypothetical protein [Hamadaea sp.]
MSDENIIQPGETRAEIVVMIGDQAKIMLEVDERGDGPPVLCILGNGVQLMLYPHGWCELGEVRQCDLDRASDLVIDATRYRDAILRKLKAQRAAMEEREAAP